MNNWTDVYNYWFGTYEESKQYLGQKMPFWFQATAEVDSYIAQEFFPLIELYERGQFPWSDWKATPQSFLSLIVLFDQFPRNIFRQDARSYAYDPLALSLAREFVGRGWLNKLRVFEQVFVMLPFEHSESLSVQRESVELFEGLGGKVAGEGRPFLDMAIDFARKHLQVIEAFGRYPHRNAVLGRQSSAAERAFLESKAIQF